MFDSQKIRADFPILSTTMRGKPLAYLDNAATTQKPQVVIDSMKNYYETLNANIHRGVYYLSEASTVLYEKTRKKIQDFIGAENPEEIIFCRGATEAINLIAHSYGAVFLKAGDEILISGMEHHSNIVPWQLLSEKIGAVLKVIPLTATGELDEAMFEKLLTSKTKIVALTHMSNALGTINPIAQWIPKIHAVGAIVVIDGAQAAAHMPVDVKALNVDFYVASSHKMYGPTGIGFLYGKKTLLEKMPPYQGGGDMIESVSFEKTTFAPLPHKFEAGTPAISEAIAFYEALNYIEQIGFEAILQQEKYLLKLLLEVLASHKDIRLIGEPAHRGAIVSFVMKGVHPHDVGSILDSQGVAVRVGHHCAMPIMEYFQVPATIRASLSFYNNEDDILALEKGLHEVRRIFK
jgi:cysteine desulfurase/selenocysteine lyase